MTRISTPTRGFCRLMVQLVCFWRQSTTTRDGRSIDTAFRRILHAIHVAEPEDTIVIVPGVYDQDLAKRIGEARSGGLSVTVAGSVTPI